MFRNRRNFQDVRKVNWVVPCSAYFSRRSLEDVFGFGAVLVEEILPSVRSRSARSRRVRNGPLKAKWHSRSNGSASGLLGGISQLIEVDTPLFQSSLMISLRQSALAHRLRSSAALGKRDRTLSGRIVGILHNLQPIAIGVEFVDETWAAISTRPPST